MVAISFLNLPELFSKDGLAKRKSSLQLALKENDMFKFKTKILWKNVVLFTYFHLLALYGLYLLLFVGTWQTFVWTLLLIQVGDWGMTVGVHRLWCHRSYKANFPLRVILMLWQTMAFQKPLYDWVRDHRVHHKYTHTDADPHNPERGHFFAHIGCLLMRKHEEVLKKGQGIDLHDVESDSVVTFQKKYWWPLAFATAFAFPALVPWYFWNESWVVSWIAPTFFRFISTLNVTLMVNSVAHAWGTKPYDKTIGPVENALLSFISSGEGWHNYHHIFPWDYKAGELGSYGLNTSTMVIDFFAALGWAYDLKTVSEDLIRSRMNRTGDSSTAYRLGYGHDYTKQEKLPWGWGDEDMKPLEVEKVYIYNKEE